MKSFTASHIFILSLTFHSSFAFALISCWVYSPDLHFEVEKEVQKDSLLYLFFCNLCRMSYGLAQGCAQRGIFIFTYSLRKLFTGFANAALILCQLTVIKAIVMAETPAKANIHQEMSIRYAKSANHLSIK